MSTGTPTFLNRLGDWSAEAARAQIDDQVPLTETVKKIASEHALNPNQIARLCEAANHSVYGQLFKQSDDRLFNFPVADYTQIVAALAGPEDLGEPKQAEPSADYDRGPGVYLPPDGDLIDYVFRHMFPKDASDSTAPHSPGVKESLQYQINERMAALSELQSYKVADEFALDDQEEEVYQEIRQSILAGKSIHDIFQVIHNTYPAVDLESAGATFQKIFQRLKGENLIDPRLEREDFTPETHLVSRETPVARALADYHKTARQVRVGEAAIAQVYGELGSLRVLLDEAR